MYLMIAQYRYRYWKSGKIYWLIPAIGISAKSHIGASLLITWIFTDMVAFLHFSYHVASEHAQCVYRIVSSVK